jgi:class 3 adenylate cyclase
MPRLHPLTLAFADPTLEHVYRRERAESSRSAWRRAYRNVAVVWLLFCVWDWLVVPDVSHTIWLLRLTVAVPPVLAAALFGYADVDRFARWSQLVGVVAFGVPAACGAIAPAWLPSLAPDIGYFVVTMQAFAHSAVLLRFIYATAVSVAVLVAYIAGVLLAPSGVHVGVINVLWWAALSMLIGMLISRSFELFRRRDFWKKRQLEEERARSDRLLLNVLPPSIAERLKRGERPIADRYDNVTVLFADIAQFTALAERSTPERVVDMLNVIFSTFDRITAEHGLEKIKTIGDAYMVVGGAPSPRGDHARAVADFALALRDAVRMLAIGELAGVAVRIGIHSGPVVAGVIGERKFSWDLWGDTVNTASRMESHGTAGEIQVSAAVAQELANDYRLERRGDIEIKGKGRMPTWFLVERLAASTVPR